MENIEKIAEDIIDKKGRQEKTPDRGISRSVLNNNSKGAALGSSISIVPSTAAVANAAHASKMSMIDIKIKGDEPDEIEEFEVVDKPKIDAPDEFFCPLTQELMQEPVVAIDGHSYERKTIEAWFARKGKGNETSPMTNEHIQDISLRPNLTLKSFMGRYSSEISAYLQKAQVLTDAALAKIIEEREKFFAKYTSAEAAIEALNKEKEAFRAQKLKDEEDRKKSEELREKEDIFQLELQNAQALSIANAASANAAISAASSYQSAYEAEHERAEALEQQLEKSFRSVSGQAQHLVKDNENAALRQRLQNLNDHEPAPAGAAASTPAHPQPLLISQFGIIPKNAQKYYDFAEQYDVKTAIEHYRLAANLGLPIAQFKLGACYEAGIGGLDKNITMAVHYYQLAAQQGSAEAALSLARLYDPKIVGKKKIKKITREEASVRAQQKTRQTDPTSLYRFGECHEKGLMGLIKDVKKAIEFYLCAAEKGERRAQISLAHLFISGEYIPKSAIEASKVAEYCQAAVLAKDADKAAEYYQLANDLSNNNNKAQTTKLKK